MSLTILQALVLKDYLCEVAKNHTLDGVADPRERAALHLKRLAPQKAEIQSALLLCDLAEAAFSSAAIQAEARAADVARATQTRQDATKKRASDQGIIAGLRSQIRVEMENRKRGIPPQQDVLSAQARLAEYENNFIRDYGVPVAL